LHLAQENRRRWELEGKAVSDLLARLVNEKNNFDGFTPETLSLFSEKHASNKEDRDVMVKNTIHRMQGVTAPVQYGARSA